MLVVVLLTVIKMGSDVDELASSIIVVGLADVVKIVVSSPVEDSFRTVVVLAVLVKSVKDNVESVKGVKVLVVLDEVSLKVESAVFNSLIVVVIDDDSDRLVENNKSEIVGFVISLLVDSSLIVSNVEVDVNVVETVGRLVNSIVDDSVESAVDDLSVIVFEINVERSVVDNASVLVVFGDASLKVNSEELVCIIVEVRYVDFGCSSVLKLELIVVTSFSVWKVEDIVVNRIESSVVVSEKGSFELLVENNSGFILDSLVEISWL